MVLIVGPYLFVVPFIIYPQIHTNWGTYINEINIKCYYMQNNSNSQQTQCIIELINFNLFIYIAGTGNIVFSTTIVTLILISYIKSIFTAPGYVPPGWVC